MTKSSTQDISSKVIFTKLLLMFCNSVDAAKTTTFAIM